jgi:hypothetical protein
MGFYKKSYLKTVEVEPAEVKPSKAVKAVKKVVDITVTKAKKWLKKK